MKRIVFILGVLEDEDVDWLIESGQRLELQPGDVLIREGEPCDQLFLILDGGLEVSVAALTTAPIAQLSTGEVVGEMSFVDGQPPSATVIALKPCIVLAISCSQLRHKLQQDIWFASRFYRALAILLSSRLRSTVKHLQGEHWRPVATPNDAGLDEMGDMLSMGGIRFDWMLKRLRDVNSNPWEEIEVDGAD
ncbi:MAG: cyclic nucleotide-binding protein [Shackletoniella antarctica]|uniref:Cyclic nucleotide-binding protein n=1 Tax=Shackletoniella antarctica TaxID=268115 RepID=A0A2W4XZ39_9CYAN|nr:MAG: cyclic nucleotide-binding protein [Shackletoniella antarctica]